MGNILPQRTPPESGAESSSLGIGGGALAHQQPLPFNAQYFYPPPRSGGGKYFGGTFIMGGDKFEMSQPEAYLFGDNLDLNYLGGRPAPFPYSAPLPNEPMHMLRALVNIRKETLKLVAVPPVIIEGAEENVPGTESPTQQYAIEFIFDADVDCTITIYLLCREEILCTSSPTSTGVRYTPKDPRHRSPPYRYKAGIGQQFSQASPLFNPHQYHVPDLSYHVLDEKGEYNAAALYPLVIHMVADGEGDSEIGDSTITTSSSISSKQSHTLIASMEKLYEEVFSLKPLKQKLFVDGLSYLLQEIYGIENKVANSSANSNGIKNLDSKTSPSNTGGGPYLPHSTSEEDSSSENSYECVICMSDLRDTLILPCRHLCLCKSCANSLRYQANNCPICRVPFRALLQIKAVKRQQPLQPLPLMINNSNSNSPIVNNGVGGGGANNLNVLNTGNSANNHFGGTHGPLLSSNHIININSQQHLVVSESLNELTVDIPPGFEIVPLVEALNGVVQQQTNNQMSYSLPKHLPISPPSPPPPALDSIELSPEHPPSEKSGASGDFEASAVMIKKAAKNKKSNSSSLESMTNNNHNHHNSSPRVAKIDIDVDSGDREDAVSFSKKSGTDEYNIKYFYNSSPTSTIKVPKSQPIRNNHHHQPKYIPVATTASSTTTPTTTTDDSTSASSSVSSSGGNGIDGVVEKIRLLRRSSKPTTIVPEQSTTAAVVMSGGGNSSSNGGDHYHLHSQSHHHHRHHLDQSSQSGDYCAEDEDEAAAAATGVLDASVVVDNDDEENVEVMPQRSPVVVATSR